MNEPVTPRRSYLFALVDGGGTVPPELGVAQRLVDRGHDVTVLAEDSMTGRHRGGGSPVPPVDAGAEPAVPPRRGRSVP